MDERHVFTPAAVSDEIHAPLDPRHREKRLLLAMAVAASLPRVLWGLTTDAMSLLGDGSGSFSTLFMALRYGGLLIDIGLLVLIGNLHTLDAIVPGTNGKRVAAIVIGAVELAFTFLPLGGFLYGVLGRFGFIAWTLPSLVASLALAAWITALLKHAGKSSLLIPVLIGAACVQAVGHLLFGNVPLLSTAVGVLVALEVLRARRAIE